MERLTEIQSTQPETKWKAAQREGTSRTPTHLNEPQGKLENWHRATDSC